MLSGKIKMFKVIHIICSFMNKKKANAKYIYNLILVINSYKNMK